MTRQKFETVEKFMMYELQHGTKGDARILMFGEVFRRFTGQNKINDARRYFEVIKKANS